MYTRSDILTDARRARLEAIREEKREARFAALIPAVGEEAAAELREIYKLFTTDMLVWYAGLWDCERGGFYFSNSGRDTLGYLPDIETTAQASGVLSSINVGTWANLMNDLQKSKMSSWVQQMQSNRDGYLYHPLP